MIESRGSYLGGENGSYPTTSFRTGLAASGLKLVTALSTGMSPIGGAKRPPRTITGWWRLLHKFRISRHPDVAEAGMN
jgi:hypothetical protein